MLQKYFQLPPRNVDFDINPARIETKKPAKKSGFQYKSKF